MFIGLTITFFCIPSHPIKGFLEVQPKTALTIGISTALAAGIAYGSVKLFQRIIRDRPPTKSVCKLCRFTEDSIVMLLFFNYFNYQQLDGAKWAKFRTFTASR